MPNKSIEPDPLLVKKLVSSALYYLSLRSRSAQEIQRYLAKKTNNDAVLTATVINKLSHFNLLNDGQFAADWIQSRQSQGKGPILVKLELRQKGLDAAIIDQALGQIEPETWIRSAAQYLERRLKPKPWSLKDNSRLYQLLYRRGFPSSVIRNVIDSVS